MVSDDSNTPAMVCPEILGGPNLSYKEPIRGSESSTSPRYCSTWTGKAYPYECRDLYCFYAQQISRPDLPYLGDNTSYGLNEIWHIHSNSSTVTASSGTDAWKIAFPLLAIPTLTALREHITTTIVMNATVTASDGTANRYNVCKIRAILGTINALAR